MTDSINDILSKKDFTEPPEISAIKRFVQDQFNTQVEVISRSHDIIITAPGASFANNLRFNLQALQNCADTNKKIMIRIKS